MTLKEKFKQWLDTNPSRTLRDIQCEVIADEFAIGFAEWYLTLTDKERKPFTINKLLEIYKKEKGL